MNDSNPKIESRLSRYDLQWCLRRAPKQVLELMKAHPDLMAAGGYVRSCITNDKINDLDLFVGKPELAEVYAKELAQNGKIHKTDNALTVRTKRGTVVQFIHRWTFECAQDLLASFDFTIACGCFWYYNGWQSLCHENYYADLAAKSLIYRAPIRNEDAGGSLLRVLKFYQRGYRIPLDSMGAVIARLMAGVKPEGVNNFVTTGCSHEQATARVITGLLREVDPAIDPTHIAHLPSEEEENESN